MAARPTLVTAVVRTEILTAIETETAVTEKGTAGRRSNQSTEKKK